jgi:alkylation response protein AidB-like acyl-CoA dehydrogenase
MVRVDLGLTSEQVQLRDASRRLLTERLDTLVEQLPEQSKPDAGQALQDAQTLGWLGLGLPESVGGLGTFEDLVVVHEELGRGLAPSLTTTLGLSARLLLHAQAPELLARLCEGSLLVAQALGTPLELAGGRLRGTQRHVVDARSVTHLLVEATDGFRVQLVLVAVDSPGVTLTDEPSATDIAQCTVTFDDVPAECVVEDAASAIRKTRTEGQVLAAARAVGGGRAVLDRTVEHVKTRHQFGRAIGTFQAVQHQLADVATSLDAAGLAVSRAAWAICVGDEHVDRAAAIAALTAGEAFSAATLVAHQLHGGMGFVLDSPLHLWSARAIADPTLPLSRRRLLDELATTAIRVAPKHRG